MKWNIVADSSCDLKTADVASPETGFVTVPFILNIGGVDFIDDENLNTLQMIEAMENAPEIGKSACPSPLSWAEEFEKSDMTFAVTISKNLSGSYNSAVAARDMVLAEHPEKKIVVIDSLATGPESALCIHKIAELIKSGHAIETITSEAQKFLDRTKTSFALSSFDNLVKNGRMSKFTGFVARKLGMWGIGIASDIGTIAMKGKSRGPKKALAFIIEDMIERGYNGGKMAISHCHNLEMAENLKAAILEKWNNAKVMILNTRGLDSFYAERGGLIIAF